MCDVSMTRGDVLLSSGFLGFASHVGFLEALGSLEFGIDALVGTSSGALVGSLFAANWRAREIERLLTRSAPIRHVALSARPWQGLFDLAPLIRLLERELPSTFEGLSLPFAVGVSTRQGEHRLITSGALPVAVAASCAVPGLFGPIRVGDAWYSDGGATDRVGLRAWGAWRPNRGCIVHRIQRSMGVEQDNDVVVSRVVVSPRSRNSLLRLRNFDTERRGAHLRTMALLSSLGATK